jgi:hypothetical protein
MSAGVFEAKLLLLNDLRSGVRVVSDGGVRTVRRMLFAAIEVFSENIVRMRTFSAIHTSDLRTTQ